MDIATRTDLTTLRQALEVRLHVLRSEIRDAELALQADPAVELASVTDQKDSAERLQEGALVEAQEMRDLDEVAQIEAALHRLDEGIYGDCVDCEEPIALARLQVQPAAVRCAGCQGRLERAAASVSRRVPPR